MPSKRIDFHKATWLDCFFIYHLRNMPETYRYFRNSRPVGLFEHLKWYSSLMSKGSDKELFVVKVEGSKAGQIRFDKSEKNSADISISILKKFMGRGVMSSIFFDIVRTYLKENRKIKKLTALINVENLPSIKFFLKMGFRKAGKGKNGWVFYYRSVEGLI